MGMPSQQLSAFTARPLLQVHFLCFRGHLLPLEVLLTDPPLLVLGMITTELLLESVMKRLGDMGSSAGWMRLLYAGTVVTENVSCHAAHERIQACYSCPMTSLIKLAARAHQS